MADNDSILQYLIQMGDLAPQEQQIALMQHRADALRQMGQPAMPQQGRVASRMPGNSWIPALAGAVGGGMMQRSADQQRLDLIKQRNQAFQTMLQQRKPNQPQYPVVTGALSPGQTDPSSGYGSEY